MRKIIWEKDFLNAEENSIETFTAILAWIHSFGSNDTSESTQEEIDEKIDLLFAEAIISNLDLIKKEKFEV